MSAVVRTVSKVVTVPISAALRPLMRDPALSGRAFSARDPARVWGFVAAVHVRVIPLEPLCVPTCF